MTIICGDESIHWPLRSSLPRRLLDPFLASQELDEPAQRRATFPWTRLDRVFTATPGQVGRQELLHVKGAQTAQRNPPVLQPMTKVFYDPDVMT